MSAISEIVGGIEESVGDMTIKMKAGLQQLDEGNIIVDKTKRTFDMILDGTRQVSEDIQSTLTMTSELSVEMESISDSMNMVNQIAEENTEVATEIAFTVEGQMKNQNRLAEMTQLLEELAYKLENATSKFQI